MTTQTGEKKINTKLLRKVKRHILEEPRRLEMSAYVMLGECIPDERRPPCGTAACIAGWATLLSAAERGEDLSTASQHDLNDRTSKTAKALLHLEKGEAFRLFYVSDWPLKFREAYREAESEGDAGAAARIAARRIDHFIKTNGAE